MYLCCPAYQLVDAAVAVDVVVVTIFVVADAVVDAVVTALVLLIPSSVVEKQAQQHQQPLQAAVRGRCIHGE